MLVNTITLSSSRDFIRQYIAQQICYNAVSLSSADRKPVEAYVRNIADKERFLQDGFLNI